MDEHLQHVAKLPDGSFVKIAQQLPDGSFVSIARPDGNGCVPCGCDDGSCWVLAWPCNCECPSPLFAFRNTPELEAAWPYSDRVDGVVASVGLLGGEFVCLSHIGSSTTIPNGTVIREAGHITGLFPTCESGPCAEIPPCAGTVGNGFAVQSFGIGGGESALCIPNGWTTKCLQTAIVTVKVSGRRTFFDSGGGGHESESNLAMTAIYRYDLAPNNQSTLTDWSVVSSASGFSRELGGGPGDTEWNVNASYTPNDGSGFNPSDSQQQFLGGGITAQMTVSDASVVSTGTSMSISADQGGVDCNGEDTVDDPTTGVWSEVRRFNASRLSGSHSVFANNLWYASGQTVSTREIGWTSKRVSYQFITTDGIVIEDDECAITALLARRCDGVGIGVAFDPADRPPDGLTMMFEGNRYYPTLEPSDGVPVTVAWESVDCPEPVTLLAVLCIDETVTISYDGAKQPPDGVTMLYDGFRYRPTETPSQNPPVEVEWSPDQCPQQWYKAVPCGTSTPIVQEGFRYQAPSPTTNGYVLIQNYPFPDIGPNCTITFAVRPTTDPADMTEAIGIHFPNRSCSQIPSVKSGCQGDSGGPTDLPESPNISDRPRAGDIAKSAIDFVTRGKLSQCSGCKKRQDMLNKLDDRLTNRG